jgi:hypothetical protein
MRALHGCLTLFSLLVVSTWCTKSGHHIYDPMCWTANSYRADQPDWAACLNALNQIRYEHDIFPARWPHRFGGPGCYIIIKPETPSKWSPQTERRDIFWKSIKFDAERLIEKCFGQGSSHNIGKILATGLYDGRAAGEVWVTIYGGVQTVDPGNQATSSLTTASSKPMPIPPKAPFRTPGSLDNPPHYPINHLSL